MIKRYKDFVLIALSIVLFSCNSENNITIYKIKKPEINNTSTVLLKWVAPKTWEVLDPGNMLLASFQAFDSKNEPVNISLSMFPGDAGGLEGNVNRWRNQIGLPTQNNEQILNNIQNMMLPLLGNAQIVNLDNIPNNKSIIVVIIPNQKDQTIFVKIIGNSHTVYELKEEFDLFYQSIYWTN